MKTFSKQLVFAGLLLFTFSFIVNAQLTKTNNKGCPGVNGLKAAEISDLLEAQNKARAEHKLTALTWDCKLADFAQEWAGRGVFEHRTDSEVGENMFVSAATDTAATAAIQRWMLEKPFWNNKTGTCQTGKTCTHFTQIVWKTTARVGCGINRNAMGKWKLLLVCNYNPAGNLPGPAF